MGMYHSAYFAYGIHVPTACAYTEAARAETELRKIETSCPDVRHLSAGGYDQNMFFLVTDCEESRLGEHTHLTPQDVTADQYDNWNNQLIAAATALGYRNTSAPGWFVVPDIS